MKNKKYQITYKGKTLNTDIWTPISDEEYENAKHYYYDLPNKDNVNKQLKLISEGGTKVNYITHYYFRDLMSDVKIYYNPWTIKDVFDYKPLVEYFKAKTDLNTKVYPTDWSLGKKMYKALSLAGKGVASPPTQFSLKVVDDILSKYNVNNNWYDFSCGWGIRLLGALRNKVNYFGSDPNYKLQDKLNELLNDYDSAVKRTTNVSLYCAGSEEYQHDMQGRIGLAFSSPPYFDIEDYKIGNQSYKDGMDYEYWLMNYVRPTIQNIYQYLVPGGYLCVNINNTKEHKLFTDWLHIALDEQFKFIHIEGMKNKHRVYGVQGDTSGEVKEYNNDEQIMVLQKWH